MSTSSIMFSWSKNSIQMVKLSDWFWVLTQYLNLPENSFGINNILKSIMNTFDSNLLPLPMIILGSIHVSISSATHASCDIIPLINSNYSLFAFELCFAFYLRCNLSYEFWVFDFVIIGFWFLLLCFIVPWGPWLLDVLIFVGYSWCSLHYAWLSLHLTWCSLVSGSWLSSLRVLLILQIVIETLLLSKMLLLLCSHLPSCSWLISRIRNSSHLHVVWVMLHCSHLTRR